MENVTQMQHSEIQQVGEHRLKRFCTAKGTINKPTRQPAEREKVFANQMPDKGLVFKRCMELRHLKTKTQMTRLQNGPKIWTDTFPEKTCRYLKRCSTLPVTRDTQVQTTVRGRLTPGRTPASRGREATSAGKDAEQRDPWTPCVNWCSHHGKQCGASSKH